MGSPILSGVAVGTALLAAVPGLASTPPPGFEDHVVVDGTAATGAAGPVAVAYEPGTGAMFVLERGGGTAQGTARVRRYDPATHAVTTALELSCVDSQGERGLLGVAIDPDYLEAGNAHRYVYLYYTRAVGPSGAACAVSGLAAGSYNTVARCKESDGTLAGEEVLLRGPQLGATNHNGGTLRFAPDGTLFVSMGDNDTDADALPKSRDLGDLRGKILRIDRDGGVPPDNPFVGQTGARPEIWAWGLRNPFRFSIDPADGTPYIADVGESMWEEIDKGTPGADYGYPCFEGDAPFRSCSPAPTNDVKPIYVYDHGQGYAVTGGPVYRGSAFPVAWQGRYFFGDWGTDWIRSAAFAADGALTDVQTFATGATDVVDIVVSPRGCLTWVGVGGAGVHDICVADGDGDGVLDFQDNCPGVANPGQEDFDGDGIGDACETGAWLADWDLSGRVDGFDLAALGRAFASSAADPTYDAAVDFTRDGTVDGDDLAVLAAHFGGVHGSL